MSIFLWVLVSITFIIAAVLLTPISLHAKGCLADKKEFQGEITWAGGLTSFGMFLGEGGNVFSIRLGFWNKQLHDKRCAGQEERLKEKTKEKKETKKNNRPGFLDITQFLNRQFFKEILNLLGRTYRSFNLRLCLEGEYGAGDPAVTGYLSALVGLINSSCCRLRLSPNFQELVLNLRGEMRARLIPAVLILHAIGFFFAPAVRKIWWKILKSKIRRKRSV